MSSAHELLLAYAAELNDHDASAAAALYADDGALDLPFRSSIGFPPAIEGPAAIEAFLVDLIELVPDFRFHGPPTRRRLAASLARSTMRRRDRRMPHLRQLPSRTVLSAQRM